MSSTVLKALAITLCLFLVLHELAAAPMYDEDSSWSPPGSGWSQYDDILPVPARRAAGFQTNPSDTKMMHAKINAVFTYLRELYDLLLRADRGSSFGHQMERKGGRSPSLRLRFGRRADPVWEAAMGSSESGAPSASGPDNPSN